jgi:putative ABC transport system substrate-binding protein
MKRREFITLVGGAAAAWPLASRAQHSQTHTLGLLSGGSPDEVIAKRMEAFRMTLRQAGFVEGQNLAMEYRWAHYQYSRLPELALDLVRRRVSIIVATGSGILAAQAAQSATTTVPILFATGSDPVQLGLVESFNRPAGNTTGVYLVIGALEGKRLEFLGELVPHSVPIAVLVNPAGPTTARKVSEMLDAARVLGRQLCIVQASSETDFPEAFASALQQRAGALVIDSDPFFNTRPEQLVALANKHAIPAIYAWRDFVDAGGLMSYGTSFVEAFRELGNYGGRILKGEKPADLPVQQSTKVELVINMKTAKALGLTVPLSLLGRADEVIE